MSLTVSSGFLYELSHSGMGALSQCLHPQEVRLLSSEKGEDAKLGM